MGDTRVVATPDTVAPPSGGTLLDTGEDDAVRDRRALRRRWRSLRAAGTIVLGLWFVGLIVFSTVLYGHNFIGQDFGTYNQAWSLIGQGHLNPLVTVYGHGRYTFLKSDFELIMWPLALAHVVFPSSSTLLWIQDIAVAGTGLVVFLWITEYLEERALRWSLAVGVSVTVLAVIVANPEGYRTVFFQFHMEPITAFFVVLAGRDLWRGRRRWAWVWTACTLLCGSFASVTLMGLGISAVLAGRRSRRQGAQIIAVAIAWSALISLLGANAGSGIDQNYAYLAGRTSLHGASGLALIVAGIVTHPSRVLGQLHTRVDALYTLVKPVGVIGFASAWGFGVPFVVLTSNALSASPGFISEPFQSSAAFPFLLLGTVMVLVSLGHRFRYGWVAALALAIVLGVQSLAYGITTSPGDVRWAIGKIPPAISTQLDLALARTPAHAQVFATEGIMGRFSARNSVYFLEPGRTFPIRDRPVVFVIVPTHDAYPISADRADIALLKNDLHARVLVDDSGVWAFEWQPPRGTTRLTLPAAPTR
jgi:Predicted membrane protein (DUF2079)